MSKLQGAWVVNVDDAAFEREVIQASNVRPVVVDFWAPWCAPCRVLTPILEKVIGAHKGDVVLAKVNIDEAPQLAARFQVQSIPLVIAFRRGRPVAEFSGAQPDAGVQEFVKQLLPTEADRCVVEADALAGSDAARAEELYRKALELDRRHESAMFGLARLLIARGADDEALTWLEEIGSSGPDGEAAERLRGLASMRQLGRPFGSEEELRKRLEKEPKGANVRYELGCVLAAQERYPEALEMLLSAGERDPDLGRSKVREAMVKVFHIVGVRSPLADEYREKLSTMLY
jgi:putative thioredoxin